MFVDQLDGLFFHLSIARVRRFIRRFHVDENDVVRIERFNRGRSLALIIGVDKSRGARYIDQIETEFLVLRILSHSSIIPALGTLLNIQNIISHFYDSYFTDKR